MDKRKFILVLWLFGMMLPIEWVTKTVPLIKRGFDIVISTEAAHVFAHMVLYGGMVFLMLYIFQLPLDRRTALLLSLCVLALGAGQELLQLQVKGRTFGGPEVFDLGVDLVGGALGWMAYRGALRYNLYLRIVYYILRGA